MSQEGLKHTEWKLIYIAQRISGNLPTYNSRVTGTATPAIEVLPPSSPLICTASISFRSLSKGTVLTLHSNQTRVMHVSKMRALCDILYSIIPRWTRGGTYKLCRLVGMVQRRLGWSISILKDSCTLVAHARGVLRPLSGPYRTLALEQVDPDLLGFQSLLSTAISLVVSNWHAWAQWLRRVSFLTESVFAKRKYKSESMFLPNSRFKS